ncbi:MAG: type III pantothenate kinase [Acidimicrobiia bacterium]|nr:type III pantothenate kinase [Acidimicrobiia bacterium]
MLLAIDVGNTQTVLGLYELGDPASLETAEGGLVGHWRAATNVEATADELAVLLDGFLAVESWELLQDVSGVAVASGVPRITAALRELVAHYFDFDPVVIEPGVRSGIPIRYDDPREVGADRIANAVGAVALYGGPTIVVDFGTGTTFDVISSACEYLGGVISPGVEISLEALFERAAALRSVELTPPRSVIGRSTAESLQSGAIYGYAAQVDGLCTRIMAEIGEATVVGTGGLADLIAPHTACIGHVQPWLTLHGLRIVWRKNAEGHPDAGSGDRARGG